MELVRMYNQWWDAIRKFLIDSMRMELEPRRLVLGLNVWE